MPPIKKDTDAHHNQGEGDKNEGRQVEVKGVDSLPAAAEVEGEVAIEGQDLGQTGEGLLGNQGVDAFGLAQTFDQKGD
jgi:hypothetical protein